MKTKKHDLKKQYAKFLADRFSGKNSVSVRFDLVSAQATPDGIQTMTDDLANKIARRFKNELNQHYFGNAHRRFRKELVLTVALHKEPHCHLHIQAEIPDRASFESLNEFVQDFADKHSWVKGDPYVSETSTDYGSQIYNARFGTDTVIIF